MSDMEYQGIINIYKEKGFTSHDVVAKMRGILHTRKIGHTGTLDPDAVGVLPVCVGEATKLCEFLTDHDKVYEAVMLLGTVTDTQDATGEVLSTTDASACLALSDTAIREACLAFTGLYDQIPPMYSALKVNGQKLVDLARKGIEVERKARPVTIYKLDILGRDGLFVKLRVHCSKGTYIRTLIHDIGARLGVGACMSSLTRVRVARFAIDDAVTLSQLEQAVASEEGASHLFLSVERFYDGHAAYRILPEYARFLENGNVIAADRMECIRPGIEDPVLLYDTDGRFCATYRAEEEKNAFDTQERKVVLYRPVKVFHVRGGKE